jgi:hypothetical protein
MLSRAPCFWGKTRGHLLEHYNILIIAFFATNVPSRQTMVSREGAKGVKFPFEKDDKT